MNAIQKQKILWLRCERKSIYEIADELNVLFQSVYNFLNNIPVDVDNTAYNPYPKLSTKKKKLLIQQYVNNEKKDLQTLSDLCNISLEETTLFFKYVKSKKIKLVISEYYPNISDWLKENNMALKTLAELIDYPSSKLSNVLLGKYSNPMSLDLAKKISQVTGLTLSEIFAEQIEQLSPNEINQYVSKEDFHAV